MTAGISIVPPARRCRRISLGTAIAIALALGAAATPAAAQPTLTVELRPPEVTVGDHVEAVLTLAVPEGELSGEPRFPVWQKTWGEAEIVRADPPARAGASGGAVTFTQRLVLAGFRPGEISLPPVEVAVPSSSGTSAVATAADLALRVRSVLPPGVEDPEPKPPAPPRPLPWGRAFWWSLAAGLALCAALGLLLWRRARRRAAGVAETPRLEPFAELLARLQEIAQLPAGASEPAHTRLSLALRRFLGRAFGFHAAESTTTEIQRQLRSRHLPEVAARRAVRLLRECDAVKFARVPAPPGALGERLGAARAVGEEVESHLRPPVPAAALEKTA
ncbi:MAG TPA: hypothetical protein VFE44_00165 [Thermoanaerobaculia bacterium]|nr:hypothetical protein [Thermoanaerobaculia bacterium]